LARALYGNPKLVVLDEPNANLDAAGDEALRAALQTLKARGTTVVVVGHRPALMSCLDKIAVLKDGAVVAFDASAALLPQLVPGAQRVRQAVAAAAVTAPAAAPAAAAFIAPVTAALQAAV
jgi:ABC-type protease/lipase transport system fused ATPase/permease subunit